MPARNRMCCCRRVSRLKGGRVATELTSTGFFDPFSGGDTPMTVVDCLIVDL